MGKIKVDRVESIDVLLYRGLLMRYERLVCIRTASEDGVVAGRSKEDNKTHNTYDL